MAKREPPDPFNVRQFPPGMWPDKPPPGYPSPNDLPSVPQSSWKNAQYTTGEIPLNFVAPPVGQKYGDVTDVLYQAVWGTPLFDLRPELGSPASSPNMQALPLRGDNGADGAGIALDVLIYDIQAFNALGIEYQCYSLEYGHPWNPQLLGRIGSREDITVQVADGGGQVPGEDCHSCELHIDMPSMRYWQWLFVINITSRSGTSEHPQLRLQAAAQ